MAALFCCSGDHFNTATASQKWISTAPAVVSGGKHGKGLLGIGNRPLATIRSRRVVMGMWIRPSSSGGWVFGTGMIPSGAAMTGVVMNPDGSFVYGVLGGSSWFSANDLWRANTWHFVEMDVLLDTTNLGYVKVYLDDPLHTDPVIDVSGVASVSSIYAAGAYYWGGIVVGNGSLSTWDDYYCLDGATTDVYGNTDAPVDPFGPVRIDVVRPDGVGDAADWVPSPADDNWENVDDESPDGGTTVNSAADDAVGDEDLHEMEDISSGDTALFQHLMVSSRKEGEGVGQLSMRAKHDGVTYDLETRLLAETYFYRNRVCLHSMPNGDPLTDANFNAQQFGYRREA